MVTWDGWGSQGAVGSCREIESIVRQCLAPSPPPRARGPSGYKAGSLGAKEVPACLGPKRPPGAASPWQQPSLASRHPDPCSTASPTAAASPAGCGPVGHPAKQGWQWQYRQPHAAHACLACVCAHLPGSESDRCSSLDEQLGHLKVATVESIMQGRDALTALATRVIHRGPMVQQETDDVCGRGG